MALYDRYSDVMSGHSPFIQKVEIQRQERILRFIEERLERKTGVKAVEVGIGIGLFARACRGRNWDYTGIDRNAKMLAALGKDFRVVEGEVPPAPAEVPEAAHDLAYSSFVFEHLADGTAGFHFAKELTRLTRPNGLVVLVVPDALSLGLEFWNLDYTHRYPTADRNVTQILLECGLKVEKIVRYKGPCYTGIGYLLLKILAFFYNYRFWTWLTGNKTLPYSIYQYVNQDVLVFIARKPA